MQSEVGCGVLTLEDMLILELSVFYFRVVAKLMDSIIDVFCCSARGVGVGFGVGGDGDTKRDVAEFFSIQIKAEGQRMNKESSVTIAKITAPTKIATIAFYCTVRYSCQIRNLQQQQQQNSSNNNNILLYP